MKRILCLTLLLLGVTACKFANDLNYPLVPGDFTAFSVEGQASVSIDPAARTISIVLQEDADISHLKASYTLSEGASVELPEYLDLREPVTVTVHTYQDYTWTISASQTIVRYIHCDNQVGEAKFNLDTKTVLVNVTESQPLASLRITEMKLEPEGSVVKSTTGYITNGMNVDVVTLPCVFPMVLDCVMERTFSVLYKGETLIWHFKALQTAQAIEVISVDARSYSAHVRATFSGSGSPQLQYRQAAETEWSPVEKVTVNGVGISGDLEGLTAGEEYVVRAVNGEEASEGFPFTTEPDTQLYNFSFDEWSQDGKGWYPYAASGEKIWDSANRGTAGLGVVPTTPEETDVILGKAVRMESSTAFGQFAAGNIYLGQFGQVSGLGAILNWGVPFSSRPVALKGYYKYLPKTVDKAKDPHKGQLGQTDQCSIRIWLTDWSSQFTVNTSKNIFLEDDDPSIIALGSLYSDKTDAAYVPFEIPLEYRDGRVPTYIEIACAASRYGDYFTGGLGSVLLIDEFELVYE